MGIAVRWLQQRVTPRHPTVTGRSFGHCRPRLHCQRLTVGHPRNPSQHCGHYEGSTELRHATATQNTQLLSSWTLPSIVACSTHSLSSSCAAERHRARLLEDSLSSKPPARQRRPLGCGFGSSISSKGAYSSILASALSLSYRNEENGGLASADEVWKAMHSTPKKEDSGTNAAAASISCKPMIIREFGARPN